ncbi:DUF3221 domain-containing protein [Halobacillus salinus]|uniref:DUF3221 domain-containing protein n=1 Tax=Halobacillus salinus TaxID=192814 RepID=A0A4Z0GVV1_9BACI|nr:DUF3221 domain-containing protein [Halobacillus salinus]TGB01092.1 DUF3221 domain-containing protein [Halobacillus salinus]
MKRGLFVMFLLIVFVLGCSPFSEKHEGFIVAKQKGNDNFSITVVSGIEKSSITDSSEENMFQLADRGGDDAITFTVSEEEYEQAELKHRVVVRYSSSGMAESYPPQTTADDVEFVD